MNEASGELQRAEYDLSVLAPNGLRRGRSTGSCATAAVRAALYRLLAGMTVQQTEVSLPDGLHYLSVPIQSVSMIDADTAQAEVLKDGGDDPDNTHGATIVAQVRRNAGGEIRFFAGEGVGTATMPGLRVAVGEPAINPVPRAMMRAAVAEVLAELLPGAQGWGFDLTIGCREGLSIAPKTFNPKLGIVGGISILGTSGIVEPMSMASWIASIEVYIRVALAACAPGDAVAYLPGKIGRVFVAQTLGLPDKRSVQIANFLGDALDFTQKALAEEGRTLPLLWLAGHPGKLAKVLDGVWDTHSSKSNMAMQGVARVAEEMNAAGQGVWFDAALLQQMKEANTVEAIIELVRQQDAALSRRLWCEIESRIAALAHARVPAVERIAVRLFDLDGQQLGEGA
ncbi:cobalt-precorrin-5B (C(1))-methyltransferase CbiD [Herbaspirillum huttiense F1]|uniref:cobalt-precorrin-5B (C(1))-methyltransferase CbiD n=1 Tax=Herbaspirillum TaxID=963 RepID=UPI001AEB1B63|nr:cobalt-precorrin-5B (C(1))-methyltransferase CbiD [Herbaspirillum huttiense]MBP1313807.1 cobalt-precorrin-5B (C1)-methyltransferase [Herbaspirillum sp. 1130]MDT0354921.1 cobalt-precorrin-5B (C(1))-methyltransferase CbiD [Herbaspirillum huttiense F1]